MARAARNDCLGDPRQMNTKLVRDLEVGDAIELDNGVGRVTLVERCSVVETKPKLGGAYRVDWTDENGEKGSAIVSAVDAVKLPAQT